VKVKIFKEAHPKIIGKGGAQIRKIREETETKIDLPRENSDSDIITITGRKENVERARSMIEAIQKELVIMIQFVIAVEEHRAIIAAYSCVYSVSLRSCIACLI
jgi:polyribonucleotide nucleotidyltransferase